MPGTVGIKTHFLLRAADATDKVADAPDVALREIPRIADFGSAALRACDVDVKQALLALINASLSLLAGRSRRQTINNG